MGKYDNVEVKVFASRKKFRSYDLQDEQRIAGAIREHVLPSIGLEYHSANVKVVRGGDQSPEYLVAYLLRKDTYTADVVKVEIDEDFTVQNILRDYEDSEEDEEEDEEGLFGTEEYATDFVAATPVPNIPSAKQAVQIIHNMALSVGLKSRMLLGPAASLANYRSYLRSGLKGFVNVGHGFKGGIVLSDGALRAGWFNALSGGPLKPAVVYFNSCQVFNPPLQPAVMHAGAKTFVGGKVNLGIGTSEEVCKCFWDRSLKLLKTMGGNLHRCEKEKYPTQGAHGISGDTGLFWPGKWFTDRAVIRTHAKHHSQMAWAIVGESPWLKVRAGAADGVSNVFMVLCEALANNHKVDIFIRNSRIDQVTLR